MYCSESMSLLRMNNERQNIISERLMVMLGEQFTIIYVLIYTLPVVSFIIPDLVYLVIDIDEIFEDLNLLYK